MFYFSLALFTLVIGADAFLGLAVWLQSPHKKINRVFAFFTLSFIVWSGVGFYIQGASPSDPIFSSLVAVPFVAAIFILYFLNIFGLNFPESNPNKPHFKRTIFWLLNLTTLPLVFFFTFTPKLMIAEVTTSATKGNGLIYGPLYKLFPLVILFWVIFALGNLLVKARRVKERRERLQMTYVFVGLFSFSTLAIINNLLIPVITGSHALARFGFLSTLFIIGFIGYAIAAHRLFNIRMFVARSVAYVLLTITLAGFYGLAVFATASTFFARNGLTPAEVAVFITLAVVLAFTYQPLHRFFERITDRIFFHNRYDSQIVLNQISTILASELIIDTMLQKSLTAICENLHITAGRFVIFENDDIYKRVVYGRPPARFFDYKTLRRLSGIQVADEVGPGVIKNLLDDHEVGVALELSTKGDVVGFLLLGDKLTGEIYSNQDITLLEILRSALAVAVTNARAYEEISRFNLTLQEQVQKATQRLRTANRNLKVLDKAKDEFLSMASHQLGTPLTAITGYLSMALDDDKDGMTPDQRQYVAYALEASERMGAMSSDLLNVSRLSAGRFVIRREPVDLTKVVGQEVEQLQPAADRKGLKLNVKTESLPLVPVDVSKTRQVIMNFIDNALYYTESGHVDVRLERHHDAVVFTVKDTGIGVPPDEKNKLFSKFYRAENAKAARPDGTGLGLYLAKQVIEEQGGSIIFESEVGKGSTFGFILPMTPPSSAVAAQKAKAAR